MTRTEGSRLILWMTTTFGVLASIIAGFYFRSFAFPADLLAQIFIVFAFLGHFIFLAFLAAIPLQVVNLILPNRRIINALSVLLFGGLIAVILFDVQLFTLYKFHLNGMVWGLITGGGAGDIFEFSLKDYFFAALFVAIVTTLVVVGITIAKRISTSKRKFGWLTFSAVFCVMLISQVIYAWSDASLYQPVVRQIAVIPWAQPLTAKRFFKKHGIVATNDEIAVRQFSDGLLNYPKKLPQCVKPAQPKNLLFIMVDALRFDVLTKEVMPHASSLASGGSQYLNHYSTGNATRFGVFGLFYGLFSSYWHTALNESAPSILIDSLNNQGYEFGVFASATLTSPEFDRTVFSSIKDKIDLDTQGNSKVERDLEITRKFASFIKQRDNSQPFFSMLFYDAAHGYAMPADFERKFKPSLKTVSYAALNNDSDPTAFLNRYKNSVNFIDTLIGQSIKVLKDSGEYDNTVIVLTSDHGQEFNDTKMNYWGHNGNFSQWQTKVPLAIIYPDRAAKSYEHLTSHVDVVPTLMRDVLGCEGNYQQYSQGWPLDQEKSHSLLLINSWSKFATFNGDNTTVFYPTGLNDTFNKKYVRQPQAKPQTEQLLKAIELNSEFLH